jgi:hypothetical protein
LKQRWSSREREVTHIAPRSHQPHCVLDYQSSKQEDWNQDEAYETKAMMICRMRRKQQKQKANRSHQQDSRSEPSLLVILVHNSHATSSHEARQFPFPEPSLTGVTSK